jgi:hypothetical protein
MKMYGRVEVQPHTFLTSALDEGEWSASHPSCFIPWERALSIHWIEEWVSPRASTNAVVTGLNFQPSAGPEVKQQ